MKEYYVLMMLKKTLPIITGKVLDFEAIGGAGCLLVFDSLESLREISPDGDYVKIQSRMCGVLS